MKFMEAVKSGKKIKIGERGYFYLEGSNIRFHSTKGTRDFEVKIELEEIQRLLEAIGINMEIVEDKKTLSKYIVHDGLHWTYEEKYVKKLIKEFIDRCQKEIKMFGLEPLAKEIFGERLI